MKSPYEAGLPTNSLSLQVISEAVDKTAECCTAAAAGAFSSLRPGALDKSRTRVLVVIPGEGEGSNFIFARRQVDSLRANLATRVCYFDSRLSIKGIIRNCSAIRSTVRDFRPDIVHVHYGTVTAFATAVITTQPLVITFHGSDLQPEPGISRLRTAVGLALSQLGALRASRIICVSSALRNRLWWRRGRVSVLPVGVNLDTFRPQSTTEARRTLGWDQKELVVLFNAGKAPTTKGLDIAESGVCEARAVHGHIRLKVMRGDVRPETVPLLMNAADCLLVTSRTEGSPTIIKEALACNLPVVSVDVGDAAERLRGVSPSYIVKSDPKEIAAALTKVLSGRERSNGREHIVALSDKEIAERLCSIYAAILS